MTSMRSSPSLELRRLCEERNEIPDRIACGTGTLSSSTLYRFESRDEVIETNAGIVGDAEDGFDELRSAILAD